MSRWLSRSTVFATFFAVTSFTLALAGKLTAEYVGAISAIHGFIVWRAIAQDKKESN